ncbi:unnamed protein product, partial [Choristocarpus tenellus]
MQNPTSTVISDCQVTHPAESNPLLRKSILPHNRTLARYFPHLSLLSTTMNTDRLAAAENFALSKEIAELEGRRAPITVEIDPCPFRLHADTVLVARTSMHPSEDVPQISHFSPSLVGSSPNTPMPKTNEKTVGISPRREKKQARESDLENSAKSSQRSMEGIEDGHPPPASMEEVPSVHSYMNAPDALPAPPPLVGPSPVELTMMAQEGIAMVAPEAGEEEQARGTNSRNPAKNSQRLVEGIREGRTLPVPVARTSKPCPSEDSLDILPIPTPLEQPASVTPTNITRKVSVRVEQEAGGEELVRETIRETPAKNSQGSINIELVEEVHAPMRSPEVIAPATMKPPFSSDDSPLANNKFSPSSKVVSDMDVGDWTGTKMGNGAALAQEKISMVSETSSVLSSTSFKDTLNSWEDHIEEAAVISDGVTVAEAAAFMMDEKPPLSRPGSYMSHTTEGNGASVFPVESEEAFATPFDSVVSGASGGLVVTEWGPEAEGTLCGDSLFSSGVAMVMTGMKAEEVVMMDSRFQTATDIASTSTVCATNGLQPASESLVAPSPSPSLKLAPFHLDHKNNKGSQQDRDPEERNGICLNAAMGDPEAEPGSENPGPPLHTPSVVTTHDGPQRESSERRKGPNTISNLSNPPAYSTSILSNGVSHYIEKGEELEDTGSHRGGKGHSLATQAADLGLE